MNDTREMVDRILSEIESVDQPRQGSTVSQVMERLLGRKADVQPVEEQPVETSGSVDMRLDMEELRRWRDKNNRTYLINTDHELRSDLRVGARIEIFIKHVIRKLIRPIIYSIVAEQNEFNASVTSSINALYNNDETLAVLIDEFEAERAKNHTLEIRLAEADEKLKQLNSHIGKQQEESKQLNNQIGKQQEESKQLNNQIGKQQEELKQLNSHIGKLQEEYDERFHRNVYDLIDYSRFERNFRGTEEDIRAMQEVYLPYFKGAENVLDLGCGRGEFLELLRENNISARGIDMYAPFVQECREKGLDVSEGDAVKGLAQIENETLDGIYSAQLIEHITPFELVKLCRESYNKLKVGGKLILETPNPTCLSVYTNAFYIDPTHKNPVHPKTLEYYLRDAGFDTVEILFPENSRINYRLPLLNAEYAVNLQEFNDGVNCLTDLIFGSQNYAIVAIK